MVERFIGFGGGHGLYSTLRALNHLKNNNDGCGDLFDITAIVGVSDDGGSSGRLRETFPIVPPGDLRMAIAALCPLDGHQLFPNVDYTTEELLQYRFDPKANSELAGHAVGNILLAALWSQGFSTVEGLSILGAILNIQGRVLPASTEPLVISARVQVVGEVNGFQVKEVIGQGAVATTVGEVLSLTIDPPLPKVSADAVTSIGEADYLIFGPGSWFTSVLPHLLISEIHTAVRASKAHKILVVNLAPQSGETSTFTASDYLTSWRKLVPDIPLDSIVADPQFVSGHENLENLARELGGVVQWGNLSRSPQSHDPVLLADSFDKIRAMKRGITWQ